MGDWILRHSTGIIATLVVVTIALAAGTAWVVFEVASTGERVTRVERTVNKSCINLKRIEGRIFYVEKTACPKRREEVDAAGGGTNPSPGQPGPPPGGSPPNSPSGGKSANRAFPILPVEACTPLLGINC